MDLPLYAFSYTGQVFPPLLAVALLAPFERFLKKVIPSMLQMVFVPMISVIVLVPVTAFLVGPIGIGVAMGISDFLKMVNDQAPALVGALIAGLYLFMVPLGLHWPLNAVMINNLQTMGTDFIQSPMGAYNFAVFGVVTGVAIKLSTTASCARPLLVRRCPVCSVVFPSRPCTVLCCVTSA